MSKGEAMGPLRFCFVKSLGETMHKSAEKISRRKFLTGAATSAIALSAFPTVFFPRRAEAFTGGQLIHPNVHPLRVVGVHDAQMTTDVMERSSSQQHNQLVRADVVAANMDRLACALAQEKDPAKAWRAIFLKPPSKGWSDVVVAIKTNHIAQQRTRSAVVGKVCTVLSGIVGVKASNIYIYDACHGANMTKEGVFKGLPEGVRLADKWGGSNVPTAIPAPYLDGKRSAKCLGHLVRGEVDILINIGLCKGHGMQFGGFTQCLKNHFGTFEPGPSHRKGGGADYLIAINKTPEILGKMDPRTGKVLFPRQQLCLIDALWASQPGPGGNSTHQPNRIFMSTFGPALDYQVGTKLRRDAMGWRVNEQIVRRFLTDFGFSEADLPNGGQIIDAMKYTG